MALTFNGSNQYIDSSIRIGPQFGFTCACWVKMSSDTTALLAAQYIGGVASYFQFAYLAGGTLFCRIQQTIDTVYIQRNSNAGAISTGVWTHVAMTWNGGTTDAAIMGYVNGTRVDTTNAGAGAFTGPSASAIRFEIAAQNSGASPVPGSIADMAAWHRPLCASEVMSLARGARPLNVGSDALEDFWPLDGYDYIADDLGYRRAIGVLVNGPTFVVGPPLLSPLRMRRDIQGMGPDPSMFKTPTVVVTLDALGTPIYRVQPQRWGW